MFPITVPPLRERKPDIALLTANFLRKAARNLGRNFDGISEQALVELDKYSWPGNVRELQNVIERAAILSPGPFLELDGALEASSGNEDGDRDRLEYVEREHILKILDASDWVIEGGNGAASKLGLNPSTLRSRMRKLGINREE